jgi:hypothetical protein
MSGAGILEYISRLNVITTTTIFDHSKGTE